MDGGSGRRGRRPLRKAQSTTQASRRAAKRPRPRTRGMGGNRRKNHPKRGTAPATAGAALSEAESAERGAGQIRVLPDDLRVQHGAPGSEVSAKPRPCSRRGCVDWAGQFRAASRCAAGRSAPVTAQRKAFFLLTAPPPFSFCRLQKENGGGKLPGFPGTPGRSTGQPGGVWSPRPTGYGGLRARHAGVVVPYGRSIGNGQRRANVPGPLPVRCLTLPTGRGKFKR